MVLAKAKISELVGDDKVANELEVQFNPSSLKLQITNQIEGGKAPGRQVRQYIGSNSTTLTLDLIFDTADEGTTEEPRSVREKTEMVERFLRPQGREGKKYVVPRIRFHWDKLVFDGVVDSLTIDMDHFAANGTPLRAKISLAIKQQNRPEELLQTGPGANAGASPQKPGGSSPGAVGTAGAGGLGASANAGLALSGESAAEFAARAGLDPAAWRGLELAGQNSLSLSAGAEVGFNLDLSARAGLGVTLGSEAGLGASLEASFGLTSDASLTPIGGMAAGAGLSAGFALSAAGGVSAALELVQVARNVEAEQVSRAAFQIPPPVPAGNSSAGARAQSVAPQPRPPYQERTPLQITGLPSPAAQAAAPPAPPPPMADSRSNSFGFGAPLRPTVGAPDRSAVRQRSQAIYGSPAVSPKAGTGEPPTTDNPTKPGWEALPARAPERARVEKQARSASPVCSCSGVP
jgi:hypothetical protein